MLAFPVDVMLGPSLRNSPELMHTAMQIHARDSCASHVRGDADRVHHMHIGVLTVRM